MLRYVVYLLEGFTVKNISIQVDTIKGYMRCVNIIHHQDHALDPPWDYDSDSEAAQLLRSQISFKGKSDMRKPLHDKVLAQMKVLGDTGSQNGFKRAVWLWANLGTSAGFCCQEFVTDKQDIQLYVLTNGRLVFPSILTEEFKVFQSIL